MSIKELPELLQELVYGARQAGASQAAIIAASGIIVDPELAEHCQAASLRGLRHVAELPSPRGRAGGL